MHHLLSLENVRPRVMLFLLLLDQGAIILRYQAQVSVLEDSGPWCLSSLNRQTTKTAKMCHLLSIIMSPIVHPLKTAIRRPYNSQHLWSSTRSSYNESAASSDTESASSEQKWINDTRDDILLHHVLAPHAV